MEKEKRRMEALHEALKGKNKVGKVMREWKAGTLRSGSAKGPKVTDKKQALSIALSEARNAGKKEGKKNDA